MCTAQRETEIDDRDRESACSTCHTGKGTVSVDGTGSVYYQLQHLTGFHKPLSLPCGLY